MDYLSTLGNVCYYILYPLIRILELLYYLVIIVAAPLIHLGHYSLHAFRFPFHIIAKFETLYIFFGVAVLVGVLVGTGLHYSTAFMASVMNLDIQPGERAGRSCPPNEAEKRKRFDLRDPLLKSDTQPLKSVKDDAVNEEYMDWEWSQNGRKKGRSSYIPNTILEEDDSTEYDF